MNYLNCKNNLLRTRHFRQEGEKWVESEVYLCQLLLNVWTKCRNGIIANVSRINEKFSDTWSHTRILKIILKQKYFILTDVDTIELLRYENILYNIFFNFENTAIIFVQFSYFHDDYKLHVLNVFQQSSWWFISEL